MTETNLNTPEKLEPFIAALHSDLEKRPISEQIIDQILAQEPTRYSVYEGIRSTTEISGGEEAGRATKEQHAAIGEFLSRWIEFEKFIRITSNRTGHRGVIWPSSRIVESLRIVDQEMLQTLDRLRYFRNNLVHGVEVPDPETIREEADTMRRVLDKLKGTTHRRRRYKPKS